MTDGEMEVRSHGAARLRGYVLTAARGGSPLDADREGRRPFVSSLRVLLAPWGAERQNACTASLSLALAWDSVNGSSRSNSPTGPM